MNFVILLPIFLIILSFIGWLIVIALRDNGSGLKVMLLGINITLVGGIIAVDANSNLGGFEYLIVFLGLIVSIVGVRKKD